MTQLAEGGQAPAFTLESSDGPVSLKDFAGRTVVVYFYPKDLTPGCTTEAQDFAKAKARFALSDPEGKVTKAWGAWGEKTMYGKKTEGVIRSTFIVGPDGKIHKAWRGVRVAGHVDAVLAEL